MFDNCSYHFSNCRAGTYSYKGKIQWGRDQQGNRICKRCYDSAYRHAEKEIDVSKLHVTNNERELTFT
jgi:hypothetical protein